MASCFKIYPDKKNRKLYFMVTVWDSKKKMYEFYDSIEERFKECDSIDKNKYEHNFVGMSFPYRLYIKKTMKMRQEIGQILLCKGNLSSEILSHECTHAALHYIRVLKEEYKENNIYDNPLEIEYEEVLCYVQGDMTQQLVNKLYKEGYYN